MRVRPQRYFWALAQQRLKEIQKDRHWYKTADLAVEVGCSLGYMYRVLRGKQEPSWSIAVAVAKALDCSLDSLTDDAVS